MTVHTIAQYDTEQPVDEILKDGDGNPIDLTSAVAVYFHAARSGQAPIIHREAIIHDPSPAGQAIGSPDRGRVRFEFDTDGFLGETAVRGNYIRQWRIDWGAGRDQRIPNGTELDFLLITKAVAIDD